MIEIEIKAHVADRNAVINRLNTIARFCTTVTRDDSYWALPESGGKKMPSIRVRRETYTQGLEKSQPRTILTYKRKEKRTGSDGTVCEVNEELETVIADVAPLETFFADSGLQTRLKKHKEVMDWEYVLPNGTVATLELCSVPPLGDFLEIEILSQSQDPHVQEAHRAALKAILLEVGLTESDIEPRYYSELLAAQKIT